MQAEALSVLKLSFYYQYVKVFAAISTQISLDRPVLNLTISHVREPVCGGLVSSAQSVSEVGIGQPG